MARTLFLLFLISSLSQLTLTAQDSLIYQSIYFGGGSYKIDTRQLEDLGQFINSVERLEEYNIIIFSHTDNIGGVAYNKWLSQMRSTSVIVELKRLGIPAGKIEVRDFGQGNPLYTNQQHEGRIRNRRVDVILWPIVF